MMASENDLAGRSMRDLRFGVRLGLVVGALILLVGLGIARCLTPSPQGFGTHRQLGLPPCTFRTLFGVRCPSCGMTTAWSHVVRGELVAAARANVGGTLLALVGVLAVPWLLITSIWGRWIVRPPNDTWLVALAGVLIAITLIDWAARLWWR